LKLFLIIYDTKMEEKYHEVVTEDYRNYKEIIFLCDIKKASSE